MPRTNQKGQSQYKRADGSMFTGMMSRGQKMARNRLGYVHEPSSRVRKCRSSDLEKVEKYLEGSQYDHLATWRECQDDEFIPVRQRKPRVVFPYAKVYQNRVASKLVGGGTFPTLQIEEDPNAQQFLAVVSKATFFKARMLSVAKNLVSYTSAFARFKIVEGSMTIESYNSNYCYPVFDASGQLVSVEIKYVFESDELDANGTNILKWFKLELGQQKDIRYDEPEYKPNSEPEFTVVEEVNHGLGFVQGTWFRVGVNNNGVDGEDQPMVCQIDGFIDSLNYNLSQSDSAAGYGMEPQLTLSGIDEEQANTLIKSATRSWLLGREGKAEFLEVGGAGLEAGKEVRDDLKKYAADASQIVFLDPEKMAANAQSGKAMEVMHAPLVELVNELRPWMAKGMIELAQKMVAAIVHFSLEGFETDFVMPEGWQPQSMEIEAKWPPIFPLTIQDMQQIISAALQMANGNLITRLSAAKWIQNQGVDLGVEDLEAEQVAVDGQKQFGGFF